MPRDVATRWNSTYDMLAFAVQYRSAIDDITGDKNANLRKFELNDNEWDIALQLFETLKVRVLLFLGNNSHTHTCYSRSSRTRHYSSLVQPQTSRR